MTVNNAVNNNAGQQLYYISKDLSSSDILNMFAAPVEIIDAPGANNIISIRRWWVEFFYNSIQYTGGGNVTLRTGGGTILSNTMSATLFTGNASITQAQSSLSSTGFATSALTNQSITISNATGAFLLGDSTARVNVLYYIEDVLDPSSNNNSLINNNAGNLMISKIVYVPSASVLNLGTTPYTLISAPGANKRNVVYQVSYYTLFNTTAYNAQPLRLRYAGDTVDLSTTGTNQLTTTESFRTPRTSISDGFSPQTPAINKDIVLMTTAGVTTGDSPLKIYLTYFVQDVL